MENICDFPSIKSQKISYNIEEIIMKCKEKDGIELINFICAVMEEKKRGSFGGSLGFVLAAAGSAVGLGNIWRFPYLTGQYGGMSFILLYLLVILLIY